MLRVSALRPLVGVRAALLLLHLWAGDTVGCEEGDQFLFCEGESESAESDAEFVVVEVAIAVEVEERELWWLLVLVMVGCGPMHST